jgi:protein-S-isoprenylcysteine O-methyltransferase Ste14
MAHRSQGVFRLRQLTPVHYWRGRDRLPDYDLFTDTYALRISVEEKPLRENLGPEYVRYSDAPSG